MNRRNRNGRPQATVPRTSSKQQQERSVHTDAQLCDCESLADLFRLRVACFNLLATAEKIEALELGIDLFAEAEPNEVRL